MMEIDLASMRKLDVRDVDPETLVDISDTLAAATIVWNYVGEAIFNMLILVGAVKMSDRLVRELMGL